MTWYPTNADDVTLIVSQVERDDSGARTGSTELANTNAIVVDDFSIETEEDMDDLSGIGNAEALGISKGDISHSFSFTVQGEDADLFNGLASNDTGRAVELEIIVRMEDYKDKLTGAWAGTRNVSASSGDAIEFEAEGIATGRDPGTV
jgi:hypothetical protein